MRYKKTHGRDDVQVKAVEHRSVTMVCAALILSVVALFPAMSRADITLVFGTYAADKPTATVRKYKPFLDFLAGEMAKRLQEPVSIRLKVSKSYLGGIEQLASGEVDFARFGPASYVTVKDLNPDIRIIAMESKKGSKRFKGVIATHQDSPIRSLSDLKGRSFAFGDKLSTIGRYLAQSHLLAAGVSGGQLAHFDYLGRHDLVGEAVGAERFDAGALKKSTFNKLVKKGVPLRVLFEFENVTKPWLAHQKVPARVVEAMRDVMLASEFEEIVQVIVKSGFLKGNDDDYRLVRDAIERSVAF